MVIKIKRKLQTEQMKITTEFIKLDSFLKFAGLAQTGGEAKQWIEEKKVLVNGEICTMRGRKLRNQDRVRLGQREIEVISGEDKQA